MNLTDEELKAVVKTWFDQPAIGDEDDYGQFVRLIREAESKHVEPVRNVLDTDAYADKVLEVASRVAGPLGSREDSPAPDWDRLAEDSTNLAVALIQAAKQRRTEAGGGSVKPIKQRIVNSVFGDCFAACLASLLELPIEVIPNGHSGTWFTIIKTFLDEFGIDMTFHNSSGPIWSDSPWIASVKSKNYSDGTTHAIIMQGGQVLFDPSTKTVYKKGTSLLGDDVVIGGYIMRISDFSLIHKLKEYRDKLAANPAQREPLK